MRPLTYGVVSSLLIIGGCIDDAYDPATTRFTGEEARRRITQWAETRTRDAKPPTSISNPYMYDGGNVFGCIEYISFDCESRDDCWAAAKSLGAPDPSEFKPWVESRYAVVMDGPGFYHESHREDPWDVRGIRDGVVYEDVQGGNERMSYFAIDFDRDRLYYHYESGGFRDVEYRPNVERR